MRAVAQSLSQGLGTFLGYVPVSIGAIVILVVGGERPTARRSQRSE